MSTNSRQDTVLEVGGRLAHGPSDKLIQTAFKQELDDQAPLFAAMGWVDIAHTLVLIDAGIVPSEPGRELLAALSKLQDHPADFIPDPALGDLYTNREAWLAGQTQASTWLGAGRARREATTTAFLMKLRESLLGLAQALTAAGLAFTDRAEELRTALMPDYTYLLAAQPTSFGHYLLGFVYPMLRDLERIRALYARVNLSPAGCGSTNGSRLPQDRERLCELLGFDGLVTHARDAMWQADLPIEAAATLTAILVNLDRLAEDLQIFSTEEFGLVELDDCHARASKIMPQKKNPFALTHVRGLANRMIGILATSAASGRTSSGQSDNRLAPYGMIPRAVEDTQGAVELMGEVASLLSFNTQRGRARMDDGSALATDLADVLVLKCGLDFRQAHRLIGYLTRQMLSQGGLNRLTPGQLAEAAERVLSRKLEISLSALQNALDPDAALAARITQGGAAPEPMATRLEECEQALMATERWVSTCSARLRISEESLIRMTIEYLR